MMFNIFKEKPKPKFCWFCGYPAIPHYIVRYDQQTGKAITPYAPQMICTNPACKATSK